MTIPGKKRWDVAVIGGGPAGCATAIALKQRGVESVCICDSGPYPKERIGETVPPDIHASLMSLGLWEGFLKEGHEQCLGSCSSWGSPLLGYNDFLLSPCGAGWRLDRSRFDAFLRRSAAARGVVFFSGVRFHDWLRDDTQGVQLELNASDGTAALLNAAFVVDATGSRSVLARQAGVGQGFLDRLTFIYGFFDISNGASTSLMTMLESEEDGWWYAARVPGRRMVVAFATDADIVRNRQLSNGDRWSDLARRTRYVGPWLEGAHFLESSMGAKVAPSFLLERVSGARWLAVGDAAASYDPLSSQGIQKALEDGVRGAEAISRALAFDPNAIAAYGASLNSRFEEYRTNRNYFYGLETRWTDRPFWKRRRARRTLQWRRLDKSSLSESGRDISPSKV